MYDLVSSFDVKITTFLLSWTVFVEAVRFRAMDWATELDRLLKEVEEDAACQKLLEDLSAYALYCVTKNEADIKDTLRNRVKVR